MYVGMRQLGGVGVPFLGSRSVALLSSVPLPWAWDRHLILRRIERMCGREILSRGFVNIVIYSMDSLASPSLTCVSAALACWRTCAHVAPAAAIVRAGSRDQG